MSTKSCQSMSSFAVTQGVGNVIWGDEQFLWLIDINANNTGMWVATNLWSGKRLTSAKASRTP